jgi:hypothetical protein
MLPFHLAEEGAVVRHLWAAVQTVLGAEPVVEPEPVLLFLADPPV